MRQRMGRGETAAFDAALAKKLTELRVACGFYPTLREIGESLTPVRSPDFIFRSLRRLSAAGKLSAEAELIYNSKKGKAHEKTENDKTKTSRKVKAVKK